MMPLALSSTPAAAENSDTAIRPFRVNMPDADLADLKRRLVASRWPDKETVADQIAGGAAREAPGTRPLLGHGLRLAEGGSEAQCPAAVHDQHRRGRHPFHPRPLSPPERAALDHHARVAGSVFEQIKLIGPLTDPAQYRGRAEDAFDVNVFAVFSALSPG
jgi:hypothetical protein